MISRVDYREALRRQEELVRLRQCHAVPDLVWFLEHPPVVTWNPGRGTRHLRVSPESLRRQGVDLARTNRGGDVTYHGPGQLVGYPIVDLAGPGAVVRDLHRYLRALEEALIETLATRGIRAERSEGGTGVWVGAEKIAAIGVRSTRWLTYHGFALNVDCDLTPFREWIVPCGIADRGVTSMKHLLGETRVPRCEELVAPLHGALEKSLGRSLAVTYSGRFPCWQEGAPGPRRPGA